MMTRNTNINYNNDKQVAPKQRHPDSHYCTWRKKTKKLNYTFQIPKKKTKRNKKFAVYRTFILTRNTRIERKYMKQ